MDRESDEDMDRIDQSVSVPLPPSPFPLPSLSSIGERHEYNAKAFDQKLWTYFGNGLWFTGDQFSNNPNSFDGRMLSIQGIDSNFLGQ